MNLLPKAMAFIDTETTGTNPARDRIIEIGILRIEDGKITQKLDRVIHPRRHIPPEIFYLTGIPKEEILRAPDFDELKHEVGEILEGAVFTAHNARFDYAFLKHEFGRFGDPFQSKVLCTIKLARMLFPKAGKYSLESLINYFGLNPKARHRAFADAEVLWQMYQIALENFGEEKVSDAINSILKIQSLPAHLPRKIVDSLPESPGIYMFFGDNSALPLYVGKSISIKDRVKGHFSSDHQNNTDLTMSSQIKRIEVQVTAGEIGALVRESTAIKDTKPVYNRQLRRGRNLLAGFLTKQGKYNSLFLGNLSGIKDTQINNILSVYKSKKSAKDSLYELSREYNLCPRLLGLEKGKGRCFAAQIGQCKGACTDAESPESYNMRFNEAFNSTKVVRWPFKSLGLIKEENINGLSEFHFIDNWMYLGSIVFNLSSEDVPRVEKYPPGFDWDIYKIIVKEVLKGKGRPPTREEEALFFGIN